MDESSNWSNWDANNYAQNNPQTTDNEGRYGWFVPNGKYRVLVSAEGYSDYRTDTDSLYGVIVIPPPRDDVNIGLTVGMVTNTFVINGVTYKFIDNTETVQVGNGTNQAVNPSSTTVTIPAFVQYNGITYSVTRIGNGAFANCLNLSNIIIPDSITIIGDWAFAYCASLSSLTIPDGVTHIGEGAFNGCSSITETTIPSSMTSISDWTFAYCEKLTNVTLPNGIKNIGGWAFVYCEKLPDITIPNGVISIGRRAFIGCGDLTEITIPSSVTAIGSEAFRNCDKLSAVYFDGNAPELGESVFSGIAVGAAAYINVTATGFPAVGESWNGLIVAYRETVTYTVVFVDWNGTVLKTETVALGKAAVAPANPVRTGWTFTGWDKNFSNIVGDLTVTAQYKKTDELKFGCNAGYGYAAIMLLMLPLLFIKRK